MTPCHVRAPPDAVLAHPRPVPGVPLDHPLEHVLRLLGRVVLLLARPASVGASVVRPVGRRRRTDRGGGVGGAVREGADGRAGLGEGVHHGRVGVAVGTHPGLERQLLYCFLAVALPLPPGRVVVTKSDHQLQYLLGPLRRPPRQAVGPLGLAPPPVRVRLALPPLAVVGLPLGTRVVVVVREGRALDPRVDYRGERDDVRLDPVVDHCYDLGAIG